MQSDCDCQWTLGTRCGHSHLTRPSSECRNRFSSGLAAHAANYRVEITLTLDRQRFPMLTRGLQAPVTGLKQSSSMFSGCFNQPHCLEKVCSLGKFEWRKEYRPLAALRTKAKDSLCLYLGNSTWTGDGFATLNAPQQSPG